MDEKLRSLILSLLGESHLIGDKALNVIHDINDAIPIETKHTIVIDDATWLAILPKHRINMLGLYCSRAIDIFGERR